METINTKKQAIIINIDLYKGLNKSLKWIFSFSSIFIGFYLLDNNLELFNGVEINIYYFITISAFITILTASVWLLVSKLTNKMTSVNITDKQIEWLEYKNDIKFNEIIAWLLSSVFNILFLIVSIIFKWNIIVFLILCVSFPILRLIITVIQFYIKPFRDWIDKKVKT